MQNVIEDPLFNRHSGHHCGRLVCHYTKTNTKNTLNSKLNLKSRNFISFTLK